MLYLVHYRYEDRQGTHGTCRTDHRLAKGEQIYAKNGRAVVYSCFEVVEVATKTSWNGRRYETSRDDRSAA